MFTHQSSERDREHTPWCITVERANESCEGGHQSGKKYPFQVIKFNAILETCYDHGSILVFSPSHQVSVARMPDDILALARQKCSLAI